MSDETETEKEPLFDIVDGHVYGGILAAAAGVGWWIHPGAGLLLAGVALASLGLRRGA